MKEKLNPGILLLVLTGLLFIAGIFLVELRTARQISDYEAQLDTFIQQVDAKKEELDNASSAYADAIQSQKDLLNWKKQQNSGTHQTVSERLPEAESADTQTSVFNQNTSPEYNSFTSGGNNDTEDETAETNPQDSEDLFSDQYPAALKKKGYLNMNTPKQQKPFFLYIIISILAVAVIGLGGLALYSLNGLASLQSKVTELQDTVQEMAETSANLVAQSDELKQLQEQNQQSSSDTVSAESASQEEGTLSPSHSSETVSSETTTDESLNNLLSQVRTLLPQDNGNWSVYVCNLMKGTEGTIDNQPMQAASLIKLFIMGAVYENYDQLCETYDADTLNSYLNPMITVSDNDAANTLVNMLGGGDDSAGMDVVNAFCQAHGYTSTSMGRLLLHSNENGDNYTSVNDCGHFLKEIYQINAGTAENPTLSHADAMYSLLKMQERRNKIPADMPEGVSVANKTGELDNVENDVGIIYNTTKGIDLVVCFMSQNLSSTGNAQETIAQDSRMIYGYYNE